MDIKFRLFVFLAFMVAIPIGVFVGHIIGLALKGDHVGYLSYWQHQWPFPLTVGALTAAILSFAWPWLMSFTQKA